MSIMRRIIAGDPCHPPAQGCCNDRRANPVTASVIPIVIKRSEIGKPSISARVYERGLGREDIVIDIEVIQRFPAPSAADMGRVPVECIIIDTDGIDSPHMIKAGSAVPNDVIVDIDNVVACSIALICRRYSITRKIIKYAITHCYVMRIILKVDTSPVTI